MGGGLSFFNQTIRKKQEAKTSFRGEKPVTRASGLTAPAMDPNPALCLRGAPDHGPLGVRISETGPPRSLVGSTAFIFDEDRIRPADCLTCSCKRKALGGTDGQLGYMGGFPGGSVVNNPVMQEMQETGV